MIPKMIEYERESFEASLPSTSEDESIAAMISEMGFELDPVSEDKLTQRPRDGPRRGKRMKDSGSDFFDSDRRFDRVRRPFRKFDVPQSASLDSAADRGEYPSYKVPSLFSGPGLGIFEKSVETETDTSSETKMPMWSYLQNRKLRLLSRQSPRNGFEEMIRLTEEGKLWHYPIDNEWKWEEEQGVGFHEHVFITPLLDKMKFPKTGPVRVFMEMVCTGLSKNPYMTVHKKKEHLEWFQEFFSTKAADIERLHHVEVAHRKKQLDTDSAFNLIE